MDTLENLKSTILSNEDRKTVSVANAADREVLQAVRDAIEHGLCSFILFGASENIKQAAEEIGLNLENEYVKIKNTSTPEDAALAAVKAVSQKEADVLMKGNIATKTLLKAVLNKDFGLRTGNILSHVALFEVPGRDRLVFLTDPAMNIAPNLKEKTEIVNNAVAVARGIGVKVPKVAVLAPVETVNEAMQSTIDAALLTQMQKRGQIKNCIVDGPLAFDNAVSVEAAEHKGIESDVAGNPDILLVPTIDVGNTLYKSFIYFAGAKVAAIVSGAKAPIVLPSRSDNAESKLYSLSLALATLTTF
ncbi:phosphate butyryltransferase [Oceanobacillus manasiensis]|uniref:phosphate butyryltransferase n=1 Tax=Oceanobacillus manasiensis TaxID=586413 RepID=UPI0005A64DD9|nr:phosphate butyryltransferase [Oceanobacillus manasiensis]